MQFCGGVTRSEEEGGTEGALHMQQATMEEAQAKPLAIDTAGQDLVLVMMAGRQGRPGQARQALRAVPYKACSAACCLPAWHDKILVWVTGYGCHQHTRHVSAVFGCTSGSVCLYS